MSDTKLNLDLDPKKVLQSLNDISEGMKELSKTIEDSLGKEGPKNITKLEEAAEKGSSRISAYFSNLGKRVKEDLKTAFDVGKLMSGLNMASTLASGVKEVFNLEKAFDRLNSRLQMSGRAYQDFKKNIGTSVSGTGQKLEDVFPGVEVAAAKGNVKSPEQLSMIAKALGEVRATTGESTEGLADSVVEIIKNQGKSVNGKNFGETLNALQGTRVSGAFKTAGEAGSAIQGLSSVLSPEQAKKMGLGTRELGGLASMASRGGEGGQDILKHILETATHAGGKEQLNGIFGSQLFKKNGQLDVGAFGKLDKKRFGQYSEQALASSTGANQADLSRFLDSMKSGMADFKKVTEGSDEVGSQFKTATSNLASGLDQFKEKTKNATREIGDDLSSAANELLKGNVKGALGNLGHAGHSGMENAGTLGVAGGVAGLAAILTGSGAKGLLSKLPKGVGGLAGGLAGGELAKAAGVTPVYVVNAAEIGGSGVGGAAMGALGKLSKFGGLAKGLGGVGLIGGALEAGSALGNSSFGDKTIGPVIDQIFKALDVGGVQSGQKALDAMKTDKTESATDHEGMAAAVAKGTAQGAALSKRPVQYTNPSGVNNRGGSM